MNVRYGIITIVLMIGVIVLLSACESNAPPVARTDNQQARDLSKIEGLEDCKLVSVELNVSPYVMHVVRCNNGDIAVANKQGKQTVNSAVIIEHPAVSNDAPLVTREQLEAQEAATQAKIQAIDAEIEALRTQRRETLRRQ